MVYLSPTEWKYQERYTCFTVVDVGIAAWPFGKDRSVVSVPIISD